DGHDDQAAAPEQPEPQPAMARGATGCPYRLESRAHLYRACYWWHEALQYFGLDLSQSHRAFCGGCHWYLCWHVELGSFLLRNSSINFKLCLQSFRSSSRPRKIIDSKVSWLPRPERSEERHHPPPGCVSTR